MDLSKILDGAHYKRTEAYVKELAKLYDLAVKDVVRMLQSGGIDLTKPINFNDYPAIKARMDKYFQGFAKNANITIATGVRNEWGKAILANNDVLASYGDKYLAYAQMHRGLNETQNKKALEAFMGRKTNGLNLSDRVWLYSTQYRDEIEDAISLSITDGTSALQLAKDIGRYLRNTDNLYRKARDIDGKLKDNYNTGRGVYRSAEKNAMRLARTEITMAYRTSTHNEMQSEAFVKGIEVRLSNNHTLNGKPFYDICDELAGVYPKDFKFVGWHPQCRCNFIAVLIDDDEMDELTERILDGEDISDYQSPTAVKDVPDNFKTWVKDNEERIAKAKSMPYFLRDNGKYFNDGTRKSIQHLIKGSGEKQQADPPKTEFEIRLEQCKTVADVAKEFKSEIEGILGYDVEVVFDEKLCDREHAINTSKELVSLSNKYNLNVPLSRVEIKKISENGKVVSTSPLYDHKKLYINVKPPSGEGVLLREYSKCDNHRIKYSTATHEYAHLLYTPKDRSNIKELFWADENFMKERDEIWEAYKKEVRKTSKAKLKGQDWYIGKYGTDNVEDFMAECFSENINSSDPSKYAKLMGELIDKYYKKN